MTLAPSGISRRWSTVGHTPDHWDCTMLFDLPVRDSGHVTIHPGGTTRYTTVVTRAGIRKLLEAVESGDACAVPACHPVHGERLLCLRPVSPPDGPVWTERPAGTPRYPGPMMFYLRLPTDQITIIFRRDRLDHLATVLAEILATGCSVVR